MFRLLKLLAYAVIAYVVYELYRGMTEGGRRGAGSVGGRRSRELEDALNRPDEGRLGTLTGPGRGTSVRTEDFQGSSATHVVGRGVVSGA